jgi:hypothetical protein
MEHDVDRPGSDYRNFDLPAQNPGLCLDSCSADTNCKAWTYVKPGVQGAKARCWLKNAVPAPVPASCCVSGLKPEPPQFKQVEKNTDRPGSDYVNFDLSAPTPGLCRNSCNSDTNCKAWTYVNPGVQGAKARCWLKNAVPAPVPSSCCVSGVK